MSLFLLSSLYKTNRFHVAVCLFSNRTQKTSKCSKNISDILACGSCATSLFVVFGFPFASRLVFILHIYICSSRTCEKKCHILIGCLFVNLRLRACLHGGGGPQIGEVTFGGSHHLSCKRDQIKMRDYVDRRVTHQSGLPHLPGVPTSM